jgi:hypothetical protein
MRKCRQSVRNICLIHLAAKLGGHKDKVKERGRESLLLNRSRIITECETLGTFLHREDPIRGRAGVTDRKEE